MSFSLRDVYNSSQVDPKSGMPFWHGISPWVSWAFIVCPKCKADKSFDCDYCHGSGLKTGNLEIHWDAVREHLATFSNPELVQGFPMLVRDKEPPSEIEGEFPVTDKVKWNFPKFWLWPFRILDLLGIHIRFKMLRPGDWTTVLIGMFGFQSCQNCKGRGFLLNKAGWWGLPKLLWKKLTGKLECEVKEAA